MKTIFQSIPESVVSALGWTLVHSVWQGTLLAIIAIVGFTAFNKKSAFLRYNFGIILLSLQLITSIATFVYYQLSVQAKNLSVNNFSSISTPVRNIPLNWQKVDYNLSMATKIQIWLNLHIYELVVCWLIGAAFLMLRFAGGWIYTERLCSSARIVMDKEWRVRFGVLTAKLNISQSVEFRETAKILTPMVIGALKPVVLIPFGFLTGFSTSQIEAILAHELAHIRRNDYLVNLLQSFVEVVFFFHPALWWISEKVRTEREHCCDEIALSVCNDKMSLAKALVKVAEWQSAPHLAMAFASKKPLLLNRISRVLGIDPKPKRILINWPVTLVFFSLMVGFSMFAIGQKKDITKEKKVNKRNQSISISKDIDASIEENINIQPIIEDVPEPVIDINIDNTFEFANDTLDKKREAYQQKMDDLQSEMEPLQRRMEELNLLTEKENFEMERFQREMEKLEWKKDKLMDARNKLVEKRSALLHPDSKSGQTKISDSDLEKQLNDFEQQIKAQEQQITEFNTQIASARKEAETYEQSESVKSIRKEISDISRKMDEIGAQMGLASFGLIDYSSAPRPPRASKAPKAPKMKGKLVQFAPPAPPSPASVPAPKPAPAPKSVVSPPSPPSPPAKK